MRSLTVCCVARATFGCLKRQVDGRHSGWRHLHGHGQHLCPERQLADPCTRVMLTMGPRTSIMVYGKLSDAGTVDQSVLLDFLADQPHAAMSSESMERIHCDVLLDLFPYMICLSFPVKGHTYIRSLLLHSPIAASIQL